MIINKDELETEIALNEQKLNLIADGILADYYEDLPEFTLTFVEPDRIRQLNRDYRQTDAVTDVLSFESDGEIDPETGKEYLGDIIVCSEQAGIQAERSGHPVENEISLLLIHGLLHLLGYDHMTEEDKDEMWRYQNLYLDKFDIKLNRKPGEDFDF